MQDIFEHLPHQQRLNENEKKEVTELLNLKVNKKLLQQHISGSAGKVVMLKDISKCEVEVRPNHVPSSCLDENVSLTIVQKYFSPDAWSVVCNVVNMIRKSPVWYCGRCTKAICDETENSIVCESCLMWFHFVCH